MDSILSQLITQIKQIQIKIMGNVSYKKKLIQSILPSQLLLKLCKDLK